MAVALIFVRSTDTSIIRFSSEVEHLGLGLGLQAIKFRLSRLVVLKAPLWIQGILF